jgi:hypothetical protein
VDGKGTDKAEGVRVASSRVKGEQFGSSVLCQIDGGERVSRGMAKGSKEGFVCVLRSVSLLLDVQGR